MRLSSLAFSLFFAAVAAAAATTPPSLLIPSEMRCNKLPFRIEPNYFTMKIQFKELSAEQFQMLEDIWVEIKCGNKETITSI